VAALALVAGAFALRTALADDDGGSVRAGGDGPGSGDGPFRILCDDDLGAACEALAGQPGVASVVVVRAGDAVERLSGEASGDDAAYDAWLTLDPWPAMLASAGGDGPPLAVTEAVPVASSPLALLIDPEASGCEDDATWACLTEPARNPVGVASLATATGPLVLAHAAVGLEGDTDFGVNQMEDTTRADLADLLRVVGSERSRTAAEQAEGLLQPGRFSAVAGPEGGARDLAARPQGRRRGLVVAVLAPEATLGVVLAGLGPRGSAAVATLRAVVTGQTVGRALAEGGWTGPASRTRGLPDPDVIYRLQEDLA